MDMLGPGILSFLERLSSLQRLKCTSIIDLGTIICAVNAPLAVLCTSKVEKGPLKVCAL